MKKILAILSLFLLCSCSTIQTNVMPAWPPVPEEQMAACPDLNLVNNENAQFSDVLNTVTENYSMYKECKAKMDSWIEWYNSQKRIYESLK